MMLLLLELVERVDIVDEGLLLLILRCAHEVGLLINHKLVLNYLVVVHVLLISLFHEYNTVKIIKYR